MGGRLSIVFMQSKLFKSPFGTFVPGFASLVAACIALPCDCRATSLAGTGNRTGVPNKRVTINFAQLARQQAEHPDTNRVARSIHPPMRESHPGTNTFSSPLPKAASPIAGGAQGPLASSSPPPQQGGSFPAILDNQRFIPPDTQGAVGPAHLMVTLNSEVAVQTRQGEVLSKMSLEGFWNSLGHSEVFDPKILYDHFHQHWLFVTLADPLTTSSALMIGVSGDSDPTGDWTLYDLDADPGNSLWADYPNVGFNEKWLVVTVNMFPISGGGLTSSRIFALDQKDLNATGAFKTFSDSASTVIPAVNYDAGQDALYLLTQQDDGKSLRIASISGPVGQETYKPRVALATSPEGWQFEPPTENFLPQLGSTVLIDGNDSRLMNCLLRNGSLWCTHHIFLPATGTVNR